MSISIENSTKSTPSRSVQLRVIENFIVVWLNLESSTFDKDSINQLRKIVNSIEIFSDFEQCLEYLSLIVNEQIFFIISHSLLTQLLSSLECISPLQSIYILSDKSSFVYQSFKKIQGIYTKMDFICKELKQDLQQYQIDLIPISILPPNPIKYIDELDQSFMYSLLIKEILLDIDYDDNAQQVFLEFARLQYAMNRSQFQIINEFKRDYHPSSPIRWYTRDCFASRMLQKAFRIHDTELILKMGFFIRDLHEQIDQLYSEMKKPQTLTVYRGQSMLNIEFERLSKNKGGLLSFNDFLLANTDRQISLNFAQQSLKNLDRTSILFHMEINPSIASSPFASIDQLSYFPDTKNAILFSMHTIFRINDIKSIGDRFYQVNLILASDNDKTLTQLTNYIRKHAREETGIQRLAKLMLVLGKLDTAKEIYTTLLENTAKDDKKELAHLHRQLGITHEENDELENALSHYHHSLNIYLSYLPLNDPQLSPPYSNIGLVLKKIGNLDGSLEYLQHALDIGLIAPNPNQAEIAIRYNNIGGVFDAQGKRTEALENYQHALEIEQKCLPSRHPLIGATHNNIGLVYYSLKDYPLALTHFMKTLEIDLTSLPSDHPSLILTHANIAGVLEDLHQYTEAIEHAEKAVHIARNALGFDHPHARMLQDYLEQLRLKQ